MRVLVIGAARSGIAVTKLLLAHQHEITLIDLNPIPDKAIFQQAGVRVIEGPHPQSLLEEFFDMVIKNPGIPHTDPFIQAFSSKGYFIYNEIEVAATLAPNYEIAAITGTNGKTTTTEILGHILQNTDDFKPACGNNGIPLSELVANRPHDELKIALEVAAFQLLGCKTFKPKYATILNLSPDHLDVFANVETYYAAKKVIFAQQDSHDYFFLNLDDDAVAKMRDEISATIITCSTRQEADLSVHQDAVYYKSTQLFKLKDLNIPGQHNVANAMLAAGMAYLMGIDVSTIQHRIQSFKGVEHRIEFVRSYQNIEFYNDSKATTAESTLMALQAFDRPVILLVGGYDKHTGFELLKDELANCKAVLAFGQTRDQFKQLYAETQLCTDMHEAIDQALAIAQAHDIVLLSPACASYDQFKNFEDRGQQFKLHILELKE